MWALLLKNFLRSRIVITGLLIVLLAGIISLFIGRQHLQKQQNSITQTIASQQEHIQRNVQYVHDEIGLLLYYLQFSLINQTDPLNALSIGQRDVNSSIQSLTIRGLHNQQYDTDLFNPYSLLAGNLDFSFVLVYLFPLLIITFMYNMLSEEKEGGTWPLVAVQSKRPGRLLLQKMAVRALVVFGALFFLYMMALLILPLRFNSRLLAAMSLSVVYLLFWFAVSYWVVSLQRTSGTNAAMLLSTWILLTVVLPGAVNNYIIAKYPVPEALATMVQQREGYHEKWDMDKKVTIDKFYAHYPQFRQYSLREEQFSWLWYYAMQQMGDDEAQQQAHHMQQKLWQREKAGNLVAFVIPTLHTQQQFNNLAHAGLQNHLHFMDSTARFHEKMRLYFYPKIFGHAPVHSENWKTFKAEYFADNSPIPWAALLLPSLVLSILFFGLARVRLTT
jgi:ABC-2 type transport system permease protein